MPAVITNIHNLPEIFMEACKSDRHITNGDISVTSLIDSPQIFQLKKKHQYNEDISDRLDMLMGTAMHHVLELSETKHYGARKLVEAASVLRDIGREKGAENLMTIAKENFPQAFNSDNKIEFNITLEVDGIKISGTMDKYIGSQRKIQDYKNTTVWNWVFPEAKKKWYAQLNVYAAMLRENGYPVDEVEIIAFFKDWKEGELLRNKDYPKTKAMVIPIKLYPHDKVMAGIKKMVERHKRAMNGETVLCTAEERWASADSFAIKTPGGKKALRVFESNEVAKNWIEENQFKYPKAFIEIRPGEQKRCNDYCPVKDFCQQRKEMLLAISNITT